MHNINTFILSHQFNILLQFSRDSIEFSHYFSITYNVPGCNAEILSSSVHLPVLYTYHGPHTILSPGHKRLSTYSFNISVFKLFSKSPNTSRDARNFEMCSLTFSLYSEEYWGNVRMCIICTGKPVMCMSHVSRIIWRQPWIKDGDQHYHTNSTHNFGS